MPLTRRSPAPWLSWLLGLLTLLALFGLASPHPVLHTDPRLSIVMIAVVAFVVNVEVPLSGHSISLGYAAGLLVLLTLGDSASLFESLAVTGLGGLLGGLLRGIWISRESRRHRTSYSAIQQLIERPLMASAQLTLSLLAGGVVFRWLDGRLPMAVTSALDAI